jgi:N-acetylneuraminate synthase/N,N'-diacetyllegionaminate synthase
MKLIAELCQNHNGDIDLLESMVHDASLNGADIIKIQSIKPESFTYRKEYEDFRKYEDELKRLKDLELSYDDEKRFVEICRDKRVEPMTTIFSIDHYDYFNSLGYDYLKLSGYSMRAFDYGLKLDKFNFKYLIFSTSSLTLEEIKRCIKNLDGVDFTILHCICLYPTPLERANLQNILYLKDLCDKVGLSDHSNPHEDNLLSSKLAIFQGIDMLERHFTILNVDETRDGKVSITPDMLYELKRFDTLSKEEQYEELNEFDETQKFNHKYYKGRFK